MDPSAAGTRVGAAFLLPFLFFLWRGWVAPGLRGRLWWFIFGLGAVQGAVGWWMVAWARRPHRGLAISLATHLLLACLILVALV